ncbi:hypothetical protein EE612_041564 [Oryza sativa]|nr:hypothetical protein EE612_041564 [Oryza sativa]
MASAGGCKKKTGNSRSRSPRSPVVLRRAMLHSSLCFLVGLLAGLAAPPTGPLPPAPPSSSARSVPAMSSSVAVAIGRSSRSWW